MSSLRPLAPERSGSRFLVASPVCDGTDMPCPAPAGPEDEDRQRGPKAPRISRVKVAAGSGPTGCGCFRWTSLTLGPAQRIRESHTTFGGASCYANDCFVSLPPQVCQHWKSQQVSCQTTATCVTTILPRSCSLLGAKVYRQLSSCA